MDKKKKPIKSFNSQDILTGHVNHTAPFYGGGGGPVGWGGAIALLPLSLYKITNDSCFISDNLEHITKWFDYIINNLNYNDSISKTDLETYKKKFLSHKNYKNLIRGKYMLAFLILFVISIRNDWKSFFFATTPAGKRSISLGTENAFENVAVRARIVPSLQEFYKASIIGTWLV